MDELTPREDDANATNSIVSAFEAELQPQVRFEEVLSEVPEFASYIAVSEQPSVKALLAKRFTPDETELLSNYIAAWNLADRAAYDRLAAGARATPAIRYTNYALGRIDLKRKDYANAAREFELEGRNPSARGSRYRAILSYLKGRDFSHVAQLQADPSYRELFTPYIQLKVAAGMRDWRTILRIAPRLQLASYALGPVLVSLVAGLAWMIFLAHLGEWNRFFSITALLCILGFLLGVLSTLGTSYLIIWQEDVLKVAIGDDPLHILLYYTAGVGLREELCKLALFAPLLPVLCRRDHELEVLIVASFVGLGFAIEENATYFLYSEAGSAAGRFLTANFFHVVLTAVNGLALYRVFVHGVRGLNEFLWVFPASVAAHGAYDALQSMPMYPGTPYLAMGVFIGSCLFYFRQAEELRTRRRMTLSLSGAFVLGVSLLAATVIAYQIARFGFPTAASLLATELAGSAILVVVFFRIFDESLSA